MNKLLSFLVVALFSGFTLSAQTQKGSHLLGGSFSIDHSTSETNYFDQANVRANENSKTNSVSIGPSYTYFVADNLGLAGNLGYNRLHTDTYNSVRTGKNTSNGYYGSISLMKYFLFDRKIGIKTGPYALYNDTKGESIYTDASYNDKLRNKYFSAGIELDFVYFPVKKIGLVASLGNLSYSQNTYKNNTYSSKQSSTGLSFLNSPSFSVYYAFGK